MTAILNKAAKKKTMPTVSLSGMMMEMTIIVMRKMLMRMFALLSYFLMISVI